MPSGCIMGECLICGELVWEDEWHQENNGDITHQGCKEKARREARKMQEVVFVAQCDVELSDLVRLKNGTITMIRDIRTVQSLREGTVKFEFAMNNAPETWIDRSDFEYPVK